MAHVGRYYPYAARRDLSICNTIMHWLPTYMVIPAYQVKGTTFPFDIPFNMLSEEYVMDADLGKYDYHWQPITWLGHVFEFWQTYELTFDSHETKVTCKMRIDAANLTRTRLGPLDKLSELYTSTLFIPVGSDGYQWDLGYARAAGWSEVP